MSAYTLDTDVPAADEPAQRAASHSSHGRRTAVLHFVRHYLEMVAAMVVGMMALGPVAGAVLGAVGLSFSHERHPDLAALEMAFTMAVGMAAWMRYRGHGWRQVLEMSGVMFLPALGLFPLLWLDVISGQSLFTLEHAAMLPLMLAVMFRDPRAYTH